MLADISFFPFVLEKGAPIISLLIGFFVLIFVLYRYAYPGITGILKERTARIQKAYTDANEALQEAKLVRDDYSGRLAAIEQEHRKRLDAAVKEAEELRENILNDAHASADAFLKRSREEIERERIRNRILLRKRVVQITLDSASDAIRQLDSEQAQRQLIQDFISHINDSHEVQLQKGE